MNASIIQCCPEFGTAGLTLTNAQSVLLWTAHLKRGLWCLQRVVGCDDKYPARIFQLCDRWRAARLSRVSFRRSAGSRFQM